MKKLMSLWMIVLILTLPIYSANVSAVTSLQVTVSGKDNVADFRKEIDTLKITAVARHEVQGAALPINVSKVVYVLPDGSKVNFQSCQENPNEAGTYACRYKEDQDDTQTTDTTVTVQLLNNDKSMLLSKDATLKVDSKEPRIAQFDITQDGEGVLVTYIVNDDKSVSSGLKKVEVLGGGSLLNSTEFKNTPVLESDTLRIKSFGAESGDKTYTLVATDKLGQSVSSEQKVFYTDFSKPKIVPNTLSVIDASTGRKLSGLDESLTRSIKISANFTDDNIPMTSFVIADLSAYGGGIVEGAIVGNLIDSTNSPGMKIGKYEWTLDNPKVNSTGKIIFELRDSKGNFNRIQENYPLAQETNPPTLVDNSFKVLVNGQSVNYISYKIGQIVNFEVKLEEEYPGLSSSAIKLDLSPIGGGEQQASDCNEDTNVWTCSWNNIQIARQPTAGSSFRLSAADRLGNSKIITLTQSIGVDADAPEIEYFGSNLTAVDGQNVTKNIVGIGEIKFNSYLMPSKNGIVAKIKETKAGIAENNVRMKGYGAGTTSDGRNNLGDLPADRCIKTGDMFTCVWNKSIETTTVVDTLDEVDGSSVLKELTVEVTDNAANSVAGKSYLLVDTTTPVIESVSVMSVIPTGKVDYHKGGDSVEVTVVVKDESPQKLGGRFTSLNLEGIVAEERCNELEQGKWECSMLTPPLPVEGGKAYPFEILVLDIVGLKKTVGVEDREDAIIKEEIKNDKLVGAFIEDNKLKMMVAKTDETPQNPKVWKVNKVEPVPEMLDREILELIDQRAYFSITFSPLVTNNPEIVEVNLIDQSCKVKEDTTDDGGYGTSERITDVGIMNNKGRVKNNPYLYIDVSRGKVDFNKLGITCSIAVRSFYDLGSRRVVLPKSQMINVTMVVEFFNLPLGQLDEVMQKKIDDERDKWSGPDSSFSKTLKVLNDIATLAKGICSLLGTLISIKELWNLITVSLDIISAIPAGKAAAVTNCAGDESYGQALKKTYEVAGFRFCKFMSCEIGIAQLVEKGLSGLFDQVTSGQGGTSQGSGQGTGGIGIVDKTKTAVAGSADDGGLNVGGGYSVGDFTGATAAKALGVNLDPFQSLPLAILQACIPAIITGLEKYRQVQCLYIDCLENQIPDGLITIDQCVKTQKYLECKYVYGDWLNLIPWVQIIDTYTNALKGIFNDPLALAMSLASLACLPSCTTSGWLYTICDIVTLVKMALQVYNDLDKIFSFSSGKNRDTSKSFSGMFKPQVDYCEILEKK